MAPLEPILAASAYVAAVFGLAGSLIGGLIAGTVSLRVARHAREAAERSWMRDSRREIYDRFLANAYRNEAASTLALAWPRVLFVAQCDSERKLLDRG